MRRQNGEVIGESGNDTAHRLRVRVFREALDSDPEPIRRPGCAARKAGSYSCTVKYTNEDEMEPAESSANITHW
jgi:hypothetical protein